mgnify:CR=1 FL=1
MKLFQRLLVAPAALGLLSPLAANATEVNLNEISNYSDIENIEFANSFNESESTESQLLAGGEGLVEYDSHDHDGGFSETTTASFSADFAIGAVDGKGITSTVTDGDEDIQASYGFQIDLNTSFTGEDSLDISIDAGNALTTGALAEFDQNGTVDKLTVDGVTYTFPLGDKTTVFVGDNTDGSALFTTACVYGGPSNTLDDCGNVNAGITGGGTSAGAAYDFGSGVTAAFGFQTEPTGIATKETSDSYAFNVAYTADTYGVSLTYSLNETGTNGIDDDTYTALNAYWTPEGFPSISAGYEVGSLGGEAAASDETLAYFVGLEFAEVGPGTFGVALGTSGSMTEASSSITEELMYEAYYSYPVNDGMTITPLVYIQEDATAGEPDRTGIMVKTSFSF